MYSNIRDALYHFCLIEIQFTQVKNHHFELFGSPTLPFYSVGYVATTALFLKPLEHVRPMFKKKFAGGSGMHFSPSIQEEEAGESL